MYYFRIPVTSVDKKIDINIIIFKLHALLTKRIIILL